MKMQVNWNHQHQLQMIPGRSSSKMSNQIFYTMHVMLMMTMEEEEDHVAKAAPFCLTLLSICQEKGKPRRFGRKSEMLSNSSYIRIWLKGRTNFPFAVRIELNSFFF